MRVLSKNSIYIITAVALAALAFSTLNFYILGFFYIAPYFLFLIKNDDLKTLLWGSFVFCFLFLIATAYVTFEPLLFLASSAIFLGLPVSFFLIKKLIREKFAMFSLPVIWTFWNIVWAYYSPLPFTVLTAGNTLGISPFVGIAATGGIIALTLFTAIVNFLVMLFLLNIKPGFNKKSFLIFTIALLIISGGYIYSKTQLKINSRHYLNLKNTINVASVSINSDFDKNFDVFKNDELSSEEKIKAIPLIQSTLEPIKEGLKNKNSDLIILPEDMIDITSKNDTDEEAYQKYQITNAGILIRAYREMAKELNSNILSIMTTIKYDKRSISGILFDKKGEISGVYDKSTLTIGSEYWPFKNWRPFYYNWIGQIIPDIKDDSPIFDQKYSYQAGKMTVLKNNYLPEIASPICVEIFYPEKLKEFRNLGAKIIIHSSSNVWTVAYGLNSYLKLSDRIRIIESVWLKTPVIFNGRSEMAGIVTPGGNIEKQPYETNNKNFGIKFTDLKF